MTRLNRLHRRLIDVQNAFFQGVFRLTSLQHGEGQQRERRRASAVCTAAKSVISVTVYVVSVALLSILGRSGGVGAREYVVLSDANSGLYVLEAPWSTKR